MLRSQVNWSIIARFAGENCRLRSLVRVPNKSLHRTQAAFVTRLATCEKPRQAARQTLCAGELYR